ncbi:hypothetical protein HOE425_310157 [Hoeflea sp. EC-HK425]|nr:hypothetical protein HOE425_310157 [Hoeflea sp. EC-HK425]
MIEADICGQFRIVEKDGINFLGNYFIVLVLASNQIGWDFVPFNFLMYPRCPIPIFGVIVGMTV